MYRSGVTRAARVPQGLADGTWWESTPRDIPGALMLSCPARGGLCTNVIGDAELL